MIIGLTGGSGTGKSTVSAYFKEKGYTVIDGDALSREITTKGSKTLKKIKNKSTKLTILLFIITF